MNYDELPGLWDKSDFLGGETDQPKRWVIVTDPGTDQQDIWSEHATFKEAKKQQNNVPGPSDIMKREANGTLTTEF